ncbi:unnamed protein product [Cochlearia groenlandica]
MLLIILLCFGYNESCDTPSIAVVITNQLGQGVDLNVTCVRNECNPPGGYPTFGGILHGTGDAYQNYFDDCDKGQRTILTCDLSFGPPNARFGFDKLQAYRAA